MHVRFSNFELKNLENHCSFLSRGQRVLTDSLCALSHLIFIITLSGSGVKVNTLVKVYNLKMAALNLNTSLSGCFLKTVYKLNWQWFYLKNFYYIKFIVQKKKEYYIEPPCVCRPGSIIFNVYLSCISHNPANSPFSP